MDKKSNPNEQRKIIPIIVMILLFGMISFITNLASPMGDILSHQFKIPNWQGTLGVFANFIAYACMGIPAGLILQRWGYKRTALFAIMVGFIGVGIQTCSGVIDNDKAFGVYLTGAFISGFSMCMLNTVVNPMLNNLGGGGRKGNQLIQIAGTWNSLSGTSVIILTGLLIPSITKAQISDVLPLMYLALGIFFIAFLVILATKIPENKPIEGEHNSSNVNPLTYRHFLLGAIAIFIYVGVEVGVPNIMNKWLQNTDIISDAQRRESIAASVAATYWFCMLIGRLIGGLVGSKMSPRVMLATVSTIGLVLVGCALLIPSPEVSFPVFKGAEGFDMARIPLSAALLVCVGLCTSVMWGGIFNLAVEGLGESTERASGIFMTLVCGGGILPLLQNFIVDRFGATNSAFIQSYWVIFVGLIYILLYAIIGSRISEKQNQSL